MFPEIVTVTVCETPGDVLGLKLASPEYVATSVLLPDVVDVSVHEPASTAAMQLSVPSVTVTVPVGVPAPGGVGVTLHDTVYADPTFEGSGVSPVITVVVSALLTTWFGDNDPTLPLKLPSPL
jgi:hypothetical protein